MDDSVEQKDVGGEMAFYVSNVVCAFTVSHPIDLKLLAKTGLNVRHLPDKKMVSMQLREPINASCSIWASGRIVCAKAQSEEEAINNAKCVAKFIQNLGFQVEMRELKVVNVMATTALPFGLDLPAMIAFQGSDPDFYLNLESHPGATMRLHQFKSTLKILATGKVTVMAPSVDDVAKALEHFIGLAQPFYKTLI